MSPRSSKLAVLKERRDGPVRLPYMIAASHLHLELCFWLGQLSLA